MSNMTDLWLSGVFFQALNTPKLVFGRGSAPDPAGGAYDAPHDPLVGLSSPSTPSASRFSAPSIARNFRIRTGGLIFWVHQGLQSLNPALFGTHYLLISLIILTENGHLPHPPDNCHLGQLPPWCWLIDSNKKQHKSLNHYTDSRNVRKDETHMKWNTWKNDQLLQFL